MRVPGGLRRVSAEGEVLLRGRLRRGSDLCGEGSIVFKSKGTLCRFSRDYIYILGAYFVTISIRS